MPNPFDLPVRAAGYVRMSTDHQRYSAKNQRRALDAYAVARQIVIVRFYADEGKSGLNLRNRPGLQALLRDAEISERDFDIVLVYDVSRWGCFQDPDEGAYYEYLMRRHGVSVTYCAEPFDNDGSPLSTIVKSVKRAMAAEFSRELSEKVARGQRTMAERGFRQGSQAGYGLRRLAVGENGRRRLLLEAGEQKATHTDRVILVPGPEEEVSTVRRIFALYVHARIFPRAIARRLMAEGAPTGCHANWYGGAVARILRNEKYVGCNVFGKQACRLRGKRTANPPADWVRVEGAFEPIVDRAIFDAAQGIRRRGVDRDFTDGQLLSGLLRILHRKGAIIGLDIQEDPELPSISYYCKRFGGLSEAYAKIGYVHRRRGAPSVRQ